MIREIVPLTECHARRYAAVHCRRCDSPSGLRLVDGEFECRDLLVCAEHLAARARARTPRRRPVRRKGRR